MRKLERERASNLKVSRFLPSFIEPNKSWTVCESSNFIISPYFAKFHFALSSPRFLFCSLSLPSSSFSLLFFPKTKMIRVLVIILFTPLPPPLCFSWLDRASGNQVLVSFYTLLIISSFRTVLFSFYFLPKHRDMQEGKEITKREEKKWGGVR